MLGDTLKVIGKYSFLPTLLPPPPPVKAGVRVPSAFRAGRMRACSGARRSFFCRIRSCKGPAQGESECLPDARRKGIVILKAWV